MISTSIAILLWTAYNILVVAKHGFQKSLSATYYTKTGRALLVPMVITTIILLGITSFGIVKPDSQFAVFLSLMGLAFVAFTPRSRDDFDGKVHSVGAAVSGIGTQLLVAMNLPCLLVMWVLYPLALLLHRRSQLFWAEMIMFCNASITILYMNITRL